MSSNGSNEPQTRLSLTPSPRISSSEIRCQLFKKDGRGRSGLWDWRVHLEDSRSHAKPSFEFKIELGEGTMDATSHR